MTLKRKNGQKADRVLSASFAEHSIPLFSSAGAFAKNSYRRSSPTICHTEIIVSVQSQAIEIHDSTLDQINLESGDAVLHFPLVYIHSSEGRPSIDAGSGWTQRQ
jgi:hypothetical protein